MTPICKDPRSLAWSLLRCAHRDTCQGCAYERYALELERKGEEYQGYCIDLLMADAAAMIYPKLQPEIRITAKEHLANYFEREDKDGEEE